MKIAYAEDITGNATERLEIVAETTDGRYVVRHFTVIPDFYGIPIVSYGSLQLRDKKDLSPIEEVKN